mmetsp:Transcript_6051/g.8990  ORF Transcript_6051/g.8990 Transcript_6051/m.8990 type:complete len:108 (-) Transcript_6051:757-1080(-)
MGRKFKKSKKNKRNTRIRLSLRCVMRNGGAKRRYIKEKICSFRKRGRLFLKTISLTTHSPSVAWMLEWHSLGTIPTRLLICLYVSLDFCAAEKERRVVGCVVLQSFG